MPSGPFTKYKFSFTSISGRHLTVLFNFKSWHLGAVTTITAGANPFVISNQNSDDNILVGIRGTSAQITYIDDGTIPVTSFASDDDDEVQVILSDDDTTEIIWEGFLVQDDCNEPFMPAPKQVTLTATDNLGLLKDLEFTDLAGAKVFDKILITDYLNILLNKTGLNLPVNTFCNVFEAAMNDRVANAANDPFAQTKIHTRTFTKDTDTFQDCYTVLQNILEGWECQLFQHMGQWFIVRWTELRYFNNLIPGTQYASDLTLPTATTLPATISIGPGQDIKFANANQVKSIVRPIKYDKLTFNYEQPFKLILNDDFKTLGALITTYTSGTDTYTEYEMPDWFDGSFSPHPDFYIRIVTNQFGVESDRYAVLKGNTGDASRSVKSTPFEVNEGDKIIFSLQWETSDSQPGNVNVVFAVSITDGATTNYLQTNGSWGLTTGFTYNVPSGDNTNTWHTVDMESQKIPFNGMMTVWLAQNSAAGNETRYKSLQINYYTLINDSTAIVGQFHKSEQPIKVIKKNIEKTLYVDDSPKNNIRGTMFLADGTTKTSLWKFPILLTYDFQFDFDGGNNFLHIDGFPQLYNYFSVGQSLTFSGTVSNNSTFTVVAKTSLVSNNFSLRLSPNVINETVFGGHVRINRQNQFGFFQKTDLMKLDYTYRTRVEGDILGIYDGGYVGILTVFSLDDLANKFFILANPKFDFKSEVSSGIVQEIWDNTETVFDNDFTNTFEYIYKTQ